MNVSQVHYAGAIMAFAGFLIYITFQTALSNQLSFYLYSNKMVFIIRLILLVLGFIILSICKPSNKIYLTYLI